jgi:sulfite reductase (NADPH) flavoprotein alpha-component
LKESITFNARHPYFARVLNAKVLTSDQAVKKCIHFELDLGNSGIEMEPGDAVGILCKNRTKEVKEIITYLQLDPSRRIEIRSTDPKQSNNTADCCTYIIRHSIAFVQ